VEIKILDKRTDEIIAFNKREWKNVNIKQYGENFEWKVEDFFLVAYENSEIVGVLRFHVEEGVGYIGSLLVAQSHRKQGLGTTLTHKAETMSKEHGAHKMYLITGKTLGTVPFYEKLGYKVTGEFLNHYRHQDFLQMTKFLV
jgi:ribosomal protein S18 acetylase RimI-like enzyme